MTHTAGAIRAAEVIHSSRKWIDTEGFREFMAKTIDEKTHAAEMLAFIEKVAQWDFVGNKNLYDKVRQAQAEAFELIKKVRG